MRVLVIEDHALLGQVLVASMEQAGITARLASGPTIDAILDAAIEFEPHLVLLDLDLGEVGDGRQLIAPLRDRDFEIVLVTGSRDTVQIAEGLEAGACGVMRKEEPFERLRDAILAVIAGQNGRFDAERQDLLAELYHHRAERAHRLAPFDRLTAREQEVLT
ncbi:MAG: response regulator, partial [Acidimicrobiia bacterium]|nr:response regulator [Acidimicrobiia bacterium]